LRGYWFFPSLIESQGQASLQNDGKMIYHGYLQDRRTMARKHYFLTCLFNGGSLPAAGFVN